MADSFTTREDAKKQKALQEAIDFWDAAGSIFWWLDNLDILLNYYHYELRWITLNYYNITQLLNYYAVN